MPPGTYRNVVILTGAGISQESGLRTFRGTDGIYNNVKIEEVASPEAFSKNPTKVHDFYYWRRQSVVSPSVVPNEAHKALSLLQNQDGMNVLLVTQNVDDLHERAGSTDILHMHGEILKARCLACERVCSWREDISLDSKCSACGSIGKMRVHVVWFGEMPFHLDHIYQALDKCDLFVAIGTSGTVYPAAGFVEAAKDTGAHTVELNLEPSEIDENVFDEGFYGPATQVVPSFVKDLTKNIQTDQSPAKK